MKNTIFSWKHFCCYLAGPVDLDREESSKWRKEWTEGLVEIGFSRDAIINPCEKPVPIGVFEFDINKEAELFNKFRSSKDYDTLCRYVREIAHIDLHLVDKSDLVLAYFPRHRLADVAEEMVKFEEASKSLVGSLSDKDVVHINAMHNAFVSMYLKYLSIQLPTYGTMHELVVATTEHKPVMVVWEGGKENCSAWLMWLVGHQNVFSSFEEMREKLVKISKGEEEYSTKDWLLFDFGRNV